VIFRYTYLYTLALAPPLFSFTCHGPRLCHLLYCSTVHLFPLSRLCGLCLLHAASFSRPHINYGAIADGPLSEAEVLAETCFDKSLSRRLPAGVSLWPNQFVFIRVHSWLIILSAQSAQSVWFYISFAFSLLCALPILRSSQGAKYGRVRRSLGEDGCVLGG